MHVCAYNLHGSWTTHLKNICSSNWIFYFSKVSEKQKKGKKVLSGNPPLLVYMGVSSNGGTPQSSILIGFSIINWVFLESLRVGFGFSTISLRNNIFSTKQHDSLRFLYETTCSLRNNILSAKQHVLYETKNFSTKLHNKYQYNLIYHLASSTEKEVLKVVFKVSKEVSKVSECFKKNIVVSKRTLLLRKVVCCRFLCEFHTGRFKNAQIINHPFWGTPIFGNTHIAIREKRNFLQWRWQRPATPVKKLQPSRNFPPDPLPILNKAGQNPTSSSSEILQVFDTLIKSIALEVLGLTP